MRNSDDWAGLDARLTRVEIDREDDRRQLNQLSHRFEAHSDKGNALDSHASLTDALGRIARLETLVDLLFQTERNTDG